MSISQLYHSWFRKIRQLRPGERLSRVKTMAWLLAGMYQSRSVQLGRIASQIPGPALRPSVVRRLERWVANPHIRVREWYEPLIQPLLAAQAGQVIRLVVDGTQVGPWHQLLLVGLAYHHRLVPLAWLWLRLPHQHGRSSYHRQLALLASVRALLPPQSRVLLVGDQEFGGVEVLKVLDCWGWQYVLRQKGSYVFRHDPTEPWQTFRAVIEKPGQRIWLGPVEFTQQHAYRTHLLAYWRTGEDEPWLLATNLTAMAPALKAYRCRPWVEETFGDLKDNGFDLESSRIPTIQHLQRLLLVVFLLYLDLLLNGTRIMKNGERRQVDRPDRRDLSFFRIGLYMRDRRLANQTPFTIDLGPRLC